MQNDAEGVLLPSKVSQICRSNPGEGGYQSAVCSFALHLGWADEEQAASRAG